MAEWIHNQGRYGPEEYPLGPYLRDFPKAPLGPQKGKRGVKAVGTGLPLTGNAAPAKAWKYDYTTGEFFMNWNERMISNPAVTYDQL